MIPQPRPSLQFRPPVQVVCAYRKCDVTFSDLGLGMKYCCQGHSKRELDERRADRKGKGKK